MQKWMRWVGPLTCLLMIASCFLPWTYYKVINETFTGFHVSRFPSGNYYGQAGKAITWMTGIILLCLLIPRTWAKRIALLPAALLLAYCMRTFWLFTGELIKGEVKVLPGIYLMMISGVLVLMAAVFSQGIDAPQPPRDSDAS